MKRFLQIIFFIMRHRYLNSISSNFRKTWYRFQGMHVGMNTILPKVYITWPHQVSIGNQCIVEHNVCFKYDGIWQNGPSIKIGDSVFIGSCSEFNISQSISIGNNSLIASGCRFIDHDHSTQLGILIRTQPNMAKSIVIGDDVWLGCNVIVLKGVRIGDGSVVAAGAVVTKSVGSNEIWAGIPAKKIGERDSK